MDNRIFNVNGIGVKELTNTLILLLESGSYYIKVVGWRIHPEKGFILYWDAKDENVTPFPSVMSATWLAPMIMNWLESDDAKRMKCIGKDADYDHDGSNEYGFRVYIEDWSRIQTGQSDEGYSIAAIRPAYLWYGK